MSSVQSCSNLLNIQLKYSVTLTWEGQSMTLKRETEKEWMVHEIKKMVCHYTTSKIVFMLADKICSIPNLYKNHTIIQINLIFFSFMLQFCTDKKCLFTIYFHHLSIPNKFLSFLCKQFWTFIHTSEHIHIFKIHNM